MKTYFARGGKVVWVCALTGAHIEMNTVESAEALARKKARLDLLQEEYNQLTYARKKAQRQRRGEG